MTARALAVLIAPLLVGPATGEPRPAAPRVAVGLDVLEADGGRPLKRKRVGLVAHAASVTEDGRHAIDVLRELGADLRRLFSPEHGLAGLAVDLQDAGVRFYTYVSTMLLCLEAAGEAGIELVVLDRPNPLGGERIEGPEREAGMPTSLVSLAPGPLVHGLTLGWPASPTRAARGRPG